jgi:hypothetical protein
VLPPVIAGALHVSFGDFPRSLSDHNHRCAGFLVQGERRNRSGQKLALAPGLPSSARQKFAKGQHMDRLMRKTVSIDRPFRLRDGTETQPAGDYEITTEEEQLGDFMFEAFRRVSTKIYLPPIAGRAGMVKSLRLIL